MVNLKNTFKLDLYDFKNNNFKLAEVINSKVSLAVHIFSFSHQRKRCTINAFILWFNKRSAIVISYSAES